MSRQRFIYPDVFESEKFAALSLGARVLFIGMFTTADDYGKGRASSRSLKAAAFRYDEFSPDQVKSWLQEILALPVSTGDEPWVVIFESAGSEYYYLPGWSKRQSPRYKAASHIPDPPENTHMQKDETEQSHMQQYGNENSNMRSGKSSEINSIPDAPANPRLIPGGSTVEEGYKRGCSGVEVKRGRRGVVVGVGCGEGTTGAPPLRDAFDVGTALRSFAAKLGDSDSSNPKVKTKGNDKDKP